MIIRSAMPSIVFGSGFGAGYRETASCNWEILRDKTGRILGRFETDTGVTRAADGKIIGEGSNQLFRLLK